MRLHSLVVLTGSAVATVLLAFACSTESPQRKLPAPSAPVAHLENGYALAGALQLPATKPTDTSGLHNVFQLSDDIVSGSEPHGDEAFQKLKEMGIKTVISVDGKTPEAELAKKYGMRYVHIPVEYKGLSDQEVEQLAKTYRECEGPFYTHCFHGMHRGPAAAAIGRIVLDGITREQAIAEMRQWCGTGSAYEGLYRDVATKAIPSEAETTAYAFDFPSQHAFSGYRDSMIAISRIDDRVKKLAGRDFVPDPAHPDVDPVHETATLADALRITGTLAEVADRPAEFHAWLKQAAQQALDLETQVTAARAGDAAALASAKTTYTDLSKTCATCHKSYRDK